MIPQALTTYQEKLFTIIVNIQPYINNLNAKRNKTKSQLDRRFRKSQLKLAKDTLYLSMHLLNVNKERFLIRLQKYKKHSSEMLDTFMSLPDHTMKEFKTGAILRREDGLIHMCKVLKDNYDSYTHPKLLQMLTDPRWRRLRVETDDKEIQDRLKQILT